MMAAMTTPSRLPAPSAQILTPAHGMRNLSQAQVEVQENRAADETVWSLPPKPLPMEVRRFKFTSIKTIEDVKGLWEADVFLELRIPDGQKYPDLMRKGRAPRFAGKRIIFPAEWYLQQIDYANAVEMRELEYKVNQEGANDLVLVHRAAVQFSEIFELHDFPVDKQGLSAELLIKCAKEGALAVELTMADDVAKAIRVDRFLVGVTYELTYGDGFGAACTTAVGGWCDGGQNKTYPMQTVTCYVSRKPWYYVWNVALPMGALAMLAMSSFLMPREAYNDRYVIPLNLLLTTIAYRFAISQNLPTVPYLTLLDMLILLTSLFIMLIVLAHVYNGTRGSDAEDVLTMRFLFASYGALASVMVHATWTAVKRDVKKETVDQQKRDQHGLTARDRRQDGYVQLDV